MYLKTIKIKNLLGLVRDTIRCILWLSCYWWQQCICWGYNWISPFCWWTYFKDISPQTIDLSITPNKIDYIVNAIKPFVPISSNKKIDGYRLWKNSLGYNNLILIKNWTFTFTKVQFLEYIFYELLLTNTEYRNRVCRELMY